MGYFEIDDRTAKCYTIYHMSCHENYYHAFVDYLRKQYPDNYIVGFLTSDPMNSADNSLKKNDIYFGEMESLFKRSVGRNQLMQWKNKS